MPYLSSLSAAAPYTLSVVTTSHVAVTAISIRRDKISMVDILMFDSTTGPMSRTVDTNVSRIVFLASAVANGDGVMRIIQGVEGIEVPVNMDAQATVDFL